MLKVNQYLNYFHTSFTPDELDLVNTDILNHAQQISINHSQFAHTEYELMYDLTNGNSLNNISNIEAMSYWDLCKDCENLWAKKCVNEALFVSLRPYCDSRTRERYEWQINKKLKEEQIKYKK